MCVYYVEKKIQSGEYEKTSTVLVSAGSESEACKKALLGECHGCEEDGNIEWTDDLAIADLGWEFHYSIYECRKVDETDIPTLKKYFRHIH